MFLFLLLILCSVVFGEYELAAVAKLKSTDGTKCIATNGDIEYWVNLATSARSATKIIATGIMEMSTLKVRDHLDVSGNKVEISAPLTVTARVDIQNGLSTPNITDVDAEIVQHIERIVTLEGKIQILERTIENLETSVASLSLEDQETR